VIALNKVDKVWNACGRVSQRFRESSIEIAGQLELVKHTATCGCDRCEMIGVLVSALLAPERLSAGAARRDQTTS
jgi:hypothetical protein